MIDAAGRALYGEDYKPKLAAALSVDLRLLQRMTRPVDPVPTPDGIREQIEGMLIGRLHTIVELLGRDRTIRLIQD
jgi:hypothetical protein